MQDLNTLNVYRWPEMEVHYAEPSSDKFGCFRFISPVDTEYLRVIASSSDGWDHISISRADRCPTWEEMEVIKRLLFKSDEVAMQLHVGMKYYINTHPYCLHLWRPLTGTIPLPPVTMV